MIVIVLATSSSAIANIRVVAAKQVEDNNERILSSSNRDGNYNIYKMNTDGTNQTRVTSNNINLYKSNPSWSPDGKKIAFDVIEDENLAIRIMNTDGSKRHG